MFKQCRTILFTIKQKLHGSDNIYEKMYNRENGMDEIIELLTSNFKYAKWIVRFRNLNAREFPFDTIFNRADNSTKKAKLLKKLFNIDKDYILKHLCFHMASAFNKFKVAKWMMLTFNLTYDEAIANKNTLIIRRACEEGRFKHLKWLHNLYHLQVIDVRGNYDYNLHRTFISHLSMFKWILKTFDIDINKINPIHFTNEQIRSLHLLKIQ